MDEKQTQELKTIPEKTSKKTWWVVGIIILVFLFVLGNSTNNQSNPSPIASTVSTSTPVSVCSDLNSIKSNVQKISYAKLDKNPDSFNGTDVKFTGQIVQIQESDGQGVIRLDVTKNDYGWSGTDIIYVTYTGTNNFVQNDVVTVYGVLQGSQTYTSQANYQITLPSINACSIEKLESNKTTDSLVSQTKEIVKNEPIIGKAMLNSNSGQTVSAPAIKETPKSWHTVTTYSNNINTQTSPFSMQGSQWRVTYSCTVADSTNTFNLLEGIIESASDGSMTNIFASGVTCPTSNTSYVYAQTAGQYYFNLEPTNANYTVKIEDYY